MISVRRVGGFWTVYVNGNHVMGFPTKREAERVAAEIRRELAHG